MTLNALKIKPLTLGKKHHAGQGLYLSLTKKDRAQDCAKQGDYLTVDIADEERISVSLNYS